MSVRVRFAPSPTGTLHVGGARTAYFNWLFARQQGGRFVLRIEDTDVERSSSEMEAGVLDDLRWLDLDWDEGPDTGGPRGPYRQSERLDRYREAAERLVSQGLAYPCFCSDAELETRRQAALAHGRPPHYDGHCRTLSAAERERLRAERRPESVRFAVEARDWVLDDLVRGTVRFPAGMVGDFVLLRASGLPTYNFAAVVDDAAMAISHVIRAEEHLPNTPRQLMLYAALREAPPAFAHVPLILNQDRSKMSKRHGDQAVAVADWREAGYVPEALLGYLALLGFNPGDAREVLSRAEMLEAFRLERVGKSGAVFDPDKLAWMNAHLLHHAGGATLRAWAEAGARPRPGGTPPEWSAGYRRLAGDLPPERLEATLELVRGNLATLADLPRELAGILEGPRDADPEARDVLSRPEARAVCAALAEELGRLASWDAETLKSALRKTGERIGVKGRDLYMPVRAALTGRLHGPELPQVVALLGRERCTSRLLEAAGTPT